MHLMALWQLFPFLCKRWDFSAYFRSTKEICVVGQVASHPINIKSFFNYSESELHTSNLHWSKKCFESFFFLNFQTALDLPKLSIATLDGSLSSQCHSCLGFYLTSLCFASLRGTSYKECICLREQSRASRLWVCGSRSRRWFSSIAHSHRCLVCYALCSPQKTHSLKAISVPLRSARFAGTQLLAYNLSGIIIQIPPAGTFDVCSGPLCKLHFTGYWRIEKYFKIVN